MTERSSPESATGYAERLAFALWEKHFREDAPDWKPLYGDLVGILTQIDNMTTGLSRAHAQGTRDTTPSNVDFWLERARSCQCCDASIDGLISGAINIIEGFRAASSLTSTDGGGV